jgi:hypothetical protein
MASIIRIQDLPADEIKQLLSSSGHRLSQEQASAVRDSVVEIRSAKWACDTFEHYDRRAEAA